MKSLQLPVRQWKGENGALYAQCGPYTETAYSENKLRANLAYTITEQLQYSKKSLDNQIKHLCMCGDGTVLVASWCNQWSYSICRGERNFAGSTIGAQWSEKDCLEAMRKHAEDFGGVKWENTFI